MKPNSRLVPVMAALIRSAGQRGVAAANKAIKAIASRAEDISLPKITASKIKYAPMPILGNSKRLASWARWQGLC